MQIRDFKGVDYTFFYKKSINLYFVKQFLNNLPRRIRDEN